jgi:uncharacterized protein (TIGR01319 family)
MAKVDIDKITSILATDCGSTTTKAILIEKIDGVFRLSIRGEAPTTVEAPVEDVTRGVINAVTEVQELAGRQIVSDSGDNLIKPCKDGKGVDLYISTSSAGGGLQMMVAGVVKSMTGESATRAALGAGAIVMDVLATNDGLLPHEEIDRIRDLRPDMILLSGGIDGGTKTHVVALAEIIAAADPRPRLGNSYELPVIYAGNKDAREVVEKVLSQKTALEVCDNIRPTLEEENLMPARLKIQEQFLEHVMAHAPGYPNLMALTDVDIMPTPGAVGSIMQTIADKYDMDVLGVDIGGATTDVFSVFQGIFNRSVSANLGMSYSISNVFAEAGLENIMRWVPFDMDEGDLRNQIKNKMIRPTTIPHLLEALVMEQATAREALRLAYEQHKSLAVGLKGVQQQRGVADVFSQTLSGQTLVNSMNLGMIIGSGGVLSHAPRRNQSALMMIDAFAPEGLTKLAVDSIFMMPQLGVLAQIHPEASTQVFEKDCLIHLGTVLAPVGTAKDGSHVVTIEMEFEDGRKRTISQNFGEMNTVELPEGATAKVKIKPQRKFDVGAGYGKELEATVTGGTTGFIIDTRGRPLSIPDNVDQRVQKLGEWYRALNIYPKQW